MKELLTAKLWIACVVGIASATFCECTKQHRSRTSRCSYAPGTLEHVLTTSSQFNMFANMAASQGGASTNGSGCVSTMYCAPWCARNVDATGCATCQCGNMGVQGLNPMSGHGSMGGMNPMNMFPALSGGGSPMTAGTHAQMGVSSGGGGGGGSSTKCSPAPRTCPAPQPWCERIATPDGCVKCMCGNELSRYMNGQTTVTSSLAPPTSDKQTTPISTTKIFTPAPSTTPTAATTSATSCIDNFYCSKLCDHGYETDRVGCPLCECISDMVDTPVAATDPPGKFTHTTPPKNTADSQTTPTNTADSQTTPTSAADSQSTHQVTECPGVFSCELICTNGYKTDGNQCPLCACQSSS